jgi:FKBP-type peptidyl-prolyl cis-trans isomerase SlyD
MQPNVISFHYVLRDDAGEVIDTSGRDRPLAFLEGSGTIIDGLEMALRSMQTGEKRKVSVAPEAAYGTYDPNLVQTVERAMLPVDELKVGDMFQAGGDHHSPVVRVIAIEGDKVKLDANHPLAGQRLHFEVEVVERREATQMEIEHGHAHGSGCCGGHHHE